MLNRSPNRLEVTAPIPVVHAWLAHHTRARAPPLSFFFLFFLLSFSSTSLTSKFALSALRVARIMRTGSYGDAQGLPLSLFHPSPPFSLRMRSMLPFRSLDGIVSSTSNRTRAARRVTTPIRHPTTHPTSGVFRRVTSFRRAAADGATCRCPRRHPLGLDPAECYHRDRNYCARDNRHR